MKTTGEFKTFYDKNLIQPLILLEKGRKQFLRKFFKLLFLFLALGAISTFLFFTLRENLMGFVGGKFSNNLYSSAGSDFDNTDPDTRKKAAELIALSKSKYLATEKESLNVILWIFLGVLFVILVAIVSYRIFRFHKKFRKSFKAAIIQPMVEFIDENLNYSPEQGISQFELMQSTIYKRSPDRYNSEDLVTGISGNTTIRFSECHSEYKSETTDGKGRTKTTWHTIFKGLFFIGDFNKHFSTRTVVLPDNLERMFGAIGKSLQAFNASRDELIKLEDPEFEKFFVVYGQDQIEARYILSTALMKRIVDFRKKTERNISLAFVDSKIFIAIPLNRNLFEPRIFRTVLNIELLSEYFEYLMLTIGITEDLNLNTRIWTKR